MPLTAFEHRLYPSSLLPIMLLRLSSAQSFFSQANSTALPSKGSFLHCTIQLPVYGIVDSCLDLVYRKLDAVQQISI